MSSKAFVFLGLLFAFVLLISSEVVAKDFAETSINKDNEATVETNGVEDAKYGRGGNGRGGYGGGGYGGGRGGSGYGGRRGGGYGCRPGSCGKRCCNYADEVVEGAKP